jgi:signal transduction histidine kinase
VHFDLGKDMTGKKTRPAPLLILIAFLFLLIGIWGTIRLSQRPGINAAFEKSDGKIRISQLEPGSMAEAFGLKSGDFVLEVNGSPVQSDSDLKFLVEQNRVGQSVSLALQRGRQMLEVTVPLQRRYGWLFLSVNFLAGLFLWVVGVFVFLKKSQSRVVRVFLISSLCFSLAVLISFEGFPYGFRALSFILPSFQIIAYALMPALFFHFSILFPREEEIPTQIKPLVYSVYLPGLVLILLMEIFYWRSVSLNSLSLFREYKTLYLYFRIYLVVYVLLGLLVLYQTYKKSEFQEDKRKIRWIFWGIAVGTFPFIFLHTLPDVLLGRTLVPEVVNYLFVLLIPVSFAFSILKYQAMDIDVVINRSLVYSILTIFILGIYLVVVGLFGSTLNRITGYEGSLFPILATLAAALLFTPAKNRIRVLVDKTFYRIRYDYRQAIQKFSTEVNDACTQDELTSLLLSRIDLLLAIDRAFMFLRQDESGEFVIAESSGFSEAEVEGIVREKDEMIPVLLQDRQVKGSKGSTTFEEFPLFPETEILNKFRIALSFPMAEKEEALGLLLIGKKKSGARYSAEDVQLVSLMVQEVARALQNIRMRKKIIAEQLEKVKLEELNKLKTKFISNVSHDLRTPLTGIRFSVDNMLQGVCGEISEESRKHLLMIQESTLHVSRTVENLLTLSMSESGKISLNKENLPLDQAVEKACSMVRILAEKKGVDLDQEKLEDTLVCADGHCLLEILLNLLDNAIKYTDSGGRICISASEIKDKKLVEVSVTDDGVGIPPENLEQIFERFHKVSPARPVERKGSGIGLDIVRNLVHLHGGDVKVESPVPGRDRGTRFSFTLPQG